MQFPQYVIYTPHWGVIPLLPRPLVWHVSNPHHKANKIVAVHSVRFTSNTNHSARLRAGQAWSAPRSGQRAPVEMGHHVWAGAHGLQGASVHELKSPRVVSLFWVLSSTSNWSSNWKPTSINSKSLSDTNTVWVWLVESNIAMEDIYVLCMLCTTVMLTNIFHLAIIVYLVYKFFN